MAITLSVNNLPGSTLTLASSFNYSVRRNYLEEWLVRKTFGALPQWAIRQMVDEALHSKAHKLHEKATFVLTTSFDLEDYGCSDEYF